MAIDDIAGLASASGVFVVRDYERSHLLFCCFLVHFVKNTGVHPAPHPNYRSGYEGWNGHRRHCENGLDKLHPLFS